MNLPNIKSKVLFIAFGLSFVIGLVFLIMPFVSQKPDGLQKVVDDTMSFLKKDDFKPTINVPMPGYTMPGLKHKFDTKQYAGIIGVFIVFGVSGFAGYLIRKKRRKNS
jgi:hypothetical protein